MKIKTGAISKYSDNDTSKFINEIAGIGSLQELSKKLDVTYATLHHACKIDRITYQLFGKIVGNVPLEKEQIDTLKKLVK